MYSTFKSEMTKLTMKLILYLFISVCVLGSTFARTPLLCSENESLVSCPGCEPSCKNPNPMCPMICRPGQACQCSAGFVRNDAGKCVQQTECSTTGGNSTQCKENETLKSCPGCEKTCANPNPVCIQSCGEGQECECSEGFVRNVAGKCVKLAECPSNGTKQCKENETLKSCPGCEKTCANPNPVCIEICREGQECECSDGFVRNDVGKCVLPFECSTSGGNNTPTECGENERLTQCSGCEANCANLDRMCPMMCNMIQKCECSPGFARNSENKCIPIAQCSNSRNPRDNGTQTEEKKCRENEVLTSCPGCEASCANKNPICTLQCRLGKECQCQKGFYRNSDGKCVTETQCSSSSQNPSNSTTSCPKNEVYMECGGCEGSCTSHNPMCTMQCRPAGCYCPVGKGFVRGPKGHCIHKSVCQKRVKDSVMNNSGEEEYNPCAATSCPVNTTCELVKVQCIKAPCPPQVRCVPVDPSTINPCSSKICPENTECKLNQVQCFTTPCPPIAECVPVNETRPSRSTPILDKCAVVRCMAGTTCVDGKCIPNSQQNPCLTTLCPPNTVCKLNQVCIRAPCPPIPECVPLNETRPSRSTPILDKCAAILCTADSTCVDGKCVKIDSPQQDPCATMRCGPNTRCERVQVMCKKAPCPPQGRCVPINETTEDPTVPLLTCETVDCIQGRVCRMLVTCLDQDKPCPPKPTCVPVPDDQQIDDPCSLIDCRDGFKCITIRTNCVMAPCNVVPVEGKCVPMNETEGIDRPDRELPNNDDPCATIKCSAGSECMTIMPDCIEGATDCKPKGICSPSPKPSSDLCATVKCAAGTKCDVMLPKCVAGAKDCGPKAVCLPITRPSRETNPNNDPCSTMRCAGGTECTVIMPSCIEGATDCGPKGVCVSTHHTGIPETASIPPMKDDPIIENIQNTFCMMARCAHGCITTGIKCNEDGTKCEYLGQCAPENFNETSVNVCENSTCPTNKKCEEEIVQCFAPPCLPIPKCVDSNQSTDVCANHKCPDGQICQPHALRCNRIVKNCKSFPVCVNKKQQ